MPLFPFDPVLFDCVEYNFYRSIKQINTQLQSAHASSKFHFLELNLELNVRLFSAIIASLATAIFAISALFCTFITVNTARLPFNSEGRYFDGIVVHHDDAILAYGLAALVMWLLTCLFGWLSRKAWQHCKN
jgi:hypothetical protein